MYIQVGACERDGYGVRTVNGEPKFMFPESRPTKKVDSFIKNLRYWYPIIPEFFNNETHAVRYGGMLDFDFDKTGEWDNDTVLGEVRAACRNELSLDSLAERVPPLREVFDATHKMVDSLQQKGLRCTAFFSGLKGSRVLWYDPTLWRKVQRERTNDSAEWVSILERYFDQKLPFLDGGIYTRGKGIKPDLLPHPRSNVAPTPLLDPNGNFTLKYTIRSQLYSDLCKDITSFWETLVRESEPQLNSATEMPVTVPLPKNRKRKTVDDTKVNGDSAVLRELRERFSCVDAIPNGYYIANQGLCAFGENHTSNNAMAYTDKQGSVWYKCFSEKCKGREKWLFNTNSQSPVHGSGVWHADVSVVTREPDENGHIQPFDLKRKVHVVNAEMNMGKSFQMKSFVKSVLATPPQADVKRVCIITSRIQLIHTLKGLLQKEGIKVGLYGEDYDAEVLICQYESLHLIRHGYQAIIIDEVRQLACNIASLKTNHKHLEENAAMLKLLLKHSTNTVLLDAYCEVDHCINEILTGIVKPDEIHVERYPPRNMQRSLLQMNNEDWLQSLTDDVKAGLKIGIPCRSKNKAIVIETHLKELGLMQDKHYKIYTSDSPDAAMLDFQNINDAWCNVQVVLFSSKVLVGADCTLPFDKVYLHADSKGGASAREMRQMQGRFRVLRDTTIRYCIPNLNSSFTTTSYEECVQHYIDRKQVLEDFVCHHIRLKPKVSGGKITWAPNFITAAFAHYRHERKRHFHIDLCEQVTRAGWQVFKSTTSGQSTTRKFDKLQKCTSERLYEEETMLYNSLISSGKWKDVIATEIRIKSREATFQDRFTMEVNSVLKRYPDRLFKYDDYTMMRDNRPQIRNVAALIRSTNEERQILEWGCGQNLKCLDVAKRNTFTIQHELLHGMLVKMGFKGVLDFETSVPSVKFEQHSIEVTDVCEKAVSILTEESIRKPRTKNAKLCAKNTLSNCLQRVFGVRVISTGRVMNQNSRQTIYKLEADQKILEFAELSDYYSRQWVDAMLNETKKKKEEYEERVRLKRKSQTRIVDTKREQRVQEEVPCRCSDSSTFCPCRGVRSV